MDLYPEMAAAMRADDADRYAALLHDDFEYVGHKSGETLNRERSRGSRRPWSRRGPGAPARAF